MKGISNTYRVRFEKESDGDYFDKAVRALLKKDYKANVDKIISDFAQAFVNENAIREMFISEYKPKRFDHTTGMSIGNEIFISRKAFLDRKTFLEGVSLFFHEAEHVKSRVNADKDSHFLEGKDFPYYASTSFDLYITSPNEHKSRLAEIIYVKRFIERMEYIMSTEEEFNTRENQKFLKRYKQEAIERERKIESDYEKGLKKKDDPKIIERRKKEAQKLLEKAIQRNADRRTGKINVDQLEASNEQSIILDYLKSYKDPEFLIEVMKHSSDFPLIMETDLLETVSNVYYFEENCDELIFSFPESSFKFALSGEAYGRHCLLYWGEKPWAAESQRNGLKKVFEELKDFKFKGIPYKRVNDVGEPEKYQITIHGEIMEFDDLNKLFLEVSKHVRSQDLKDLTPEKIEELNEIFDEKFIEYSPVEESENEENETDPHLQYSNSYHDIEMS